MKPGYPLVSLPPVAYVFEEGRPNGWVHATLKTGWREPSTPLSGPRAQGPRPGRGSCLARVRRSVPVSSLLVLFVVPRHYQWNSAAGAGGGACALPGRLVFGNMLEIYLQLLHKNIDTNCLYGRFAPGRRMIRGQADGKMEWI